MCVRKLIDFAYQTLKALLNVSGVNLTDIDEIKEQNLIIVNKKGATFISLAPFYDIGGIYVKVSAPVKKDFTFCQIMVQFL